MQQHVGRHRLRALLVPGGSPEEQLEAPHFAAGVEHRLAADQERSGLRVGDQVFYGHPGPSPLRRPAIVFEIGSSVLTLPVPS